MSKKGLTGPPGGKYETKDKSLTETARRETLEETKYLLQKGGLKKWVTIYKDHPTKNEEHTIHLYLYNLDENKITLTNFEQEAEDFPMTQVNFRRVIDISKKERTWVLKFIACMWDCFNE